MRQTSSTPRDAARERLWVALRSCARAASSVRETFIAKPEHSLAGTIAVLLFVRTASLGAGCGMRRRTGRLADIDPLHEDNPVGPLQVIPFLTLYLRDGVRLPP